jgi:hypothetical protein
MLRHLLPLSEPPERIPKEDRVFVLHFDDDERGIIDISQTGVGILVLEKRCERFVSDRPELRRHGDDAVGVLALRLAFQLGIERRVVAVVRADGEVIEDGPVAVDAVLLQLGEPPVVLVEFLRVHFAVSAHSSKTAC